MSGEGIAHVISALTTALWAFLGFYVVWLLRTQIIALVGRLSGFEGFGLRLALSGGQALDAAIELARENSNWPVEVSAADRGAAIDRASAHRSAFEGAEILWVGGMPSNNRNEARVLDAHVLLSLREDSIASLDALRAVIPGILLSPVQLRPLDRAAEQALRKPVQLWSKVRFGDPHSVVIDDALLTTLLDQVRQAGRSSLAADPANEPAAETVELPLLQHSLDRLWQEEANADKVALRQRTLDMLGGACGMARRHLQETMDDLSIEQRRLSLQLLGRLVTPSGGKLAWRADGLARELGSGRATMRDVASARSLGGSPEHRPRWPRGSSVKVRNAPPVSGALGDITTTKAVVSDTMGRLAAGRTRILRTQPDPRGHGPLFELYHDALADPVPGWVQEARIREAERRQQRRAAIAVGLATLMA